MKASNKQLDMTHGPLLKKIVFFSIPLIFTGLLQCLYNSADLVVVGHFEGHIALAAVGNTNSLTNLILGVFMGLSVGSSVCAAQYIGARDYEKVKKVTHTSVVLSLIIGLVVGAMGFIFAPQLLRLMGTPDNVIDHSALYIRIIFCGVPASLLYNYCAAILRSSGDTTRPLIFLTISGLCNVLLNLVFVAVFHMGVAGVAIATIISQLLSAIMIVVYMARYDGYLRLNLKDMRISRECLGRILAIGVPSGLHGALFSLSNVVIQSSINSFNDVVMAGNSAATNIENFIWVSMNSVHQAAVTFTGQNIGAKKYPRIKNVFICCSLVTLIAWAISTGAALLFRRELLAMFAGDSEEVITAGLSRMMIVAPTYILCGIMDIVGGSLRGMGKSTSTMIISLVSVCGFRIIWINTIFKIFNTTTSVYLCYPVSWIICLAGNLAVFVFAYKKLLKTGDLPKSKLSFLKRRKVS